VTATAAGAPVREALQGASEALAAAGIETSRLDAELLLCEATGWERERFATEPDAELPAAAAREFAAMVRRRLRREPLAYITGRKGFRSIELVVDTRVLIPRPETELLVDVALELEPASVLDVGTGSGAVALAIAEELPDCELTATDTSEGALAVARDNARRLGLASRVRMMPGSVPAYEGPFDLVLANLPYVTEAEWTGLEPEIREHEPRVALVAGPDGLDAIRAVLGDLSPAMAPAVALEVGEAQAAEVRRLIEAAGFGKVETWQDLAGVERVVIGRDG
jgi:release factor glutamine methyltransferase